MPSGYKLTQQEVERRIRELHGDDISLAKFTYVTQRTKSVFICNLNPDHGEWLAHPKELTRTDGKKTGCPKCGKNKNKPKEEWDRVYTRLREVHKEDELIFYEETYTGVGRKITTKCLIHDHEWQIRVADLINGQGCPRCRYIKSGKSLVLKVPEFIERARKVHGDKYDYSKVHQFKRQKERVVIVCPAHGEFSQGAQDHFNGAGCPKCWEEIRSEVLTIPWEEVLKSFRETHGEQYQYDSQGYENSSSKLRIRCSKHGEFVQDVTAHKHGQGCPKCGRERISDFLTTPWEEVLKSFRETHRDEYEYNSETYSLLEEPMEMFCKKHGMFMQAPKVHRLGSGCPICKSSRGEKEIEFCLRDLGIEYEHQKKFPDWNKYYRYDFYIPSINTIIEYNGLQHYEPIEFFGGDKALKSTQKRDRIKRQYCTDNHINYEVIRYDEDINLRIAEILDKT